MNRHYVIASLCIIFLLSLFVFQQINLTTADLGRHIINGKLLLSSANLDISKNALLHTNFFSFTNPDFPFINHHSGSGILFYIIFSIFGFGGLSLFYGLTIILSSLILFYIWRNILPIFVSFPIILFLIPLIGERTEVRPEGLGYIFITLIITILYLYNTNQIQKKWLYSIPIISLIFVNTHIYFIFAPFIIGMFLLETLIQKDFTKSKTLLLILGISSLAICINPYGLYGVIYPFIVFKNYGYMVAENQSIPFLIRLGMNNPNFLWWALSTFLLSITSIFTIWKYPRKFPIALFGISFVFGVLGFLGIRHLTLYGLSLIPILLYYASIYYKKPASPPASPNRGESLGGTETEKELETHILYSIVISIIIFISIALNFHTRLPWNTNWGLGLMPKVNASVEFFKTQNIKGPIFSNYDIGGYLIYHLYGKEKVFIDNRPEGYPTEFFQNEYVPMQTDEKIWNTELQKWNFNVIYFYRKDMTPWAQPFLITRIKDSLWAPVFVDDYTIILLKKNKENAAIIEKYELPQSMFSITK